MNTLIWIRTLPTRLLLLAQDTTTPPDTAVPVDTTPVDTTSATTVPADTTAPADTTLPVDTTLPDAPSSTPGTPEEIFTGDAFAMLSWLLKIGGTVAAVVVVLRVLFYKRDPKAGVVWNVIGRGVLALFVGWLVLYISFNPVVVLRFAQEIGRAIARLFDMVNSAA